MLSIGEVGTQILTGNPKHFYIFIGNEYGIKRKYLEHLKDHYHGFTEIENVSDLFKIMRKRQVIPLQPLLYVARYDESFLQSLDKQSVNKVKKEVKNIVGTLVCIYEEPKQVSKCTKYLEDYTVSFDGVNKSFIKKYLMEDFSELNPNYIDLIVQMHDDYQSAYYACLSLNNLDKSLVEKYDNKAISTVLGTHSGTSEKDFRYGVAARNFAYCLKAIESYEGQPEKLLYTFLSTLLDMEKLLSNPKQNSDLAKYRKCWNISDIYYMFMRVYHEIENSRNFSNYNIRSRLIYLIGILQFSPIPEVKTA